MIKTVLSILIFGFVAQALGSPSHAGIMTGRYAIRDGLANKTITATDQRGLPDRVTTVASMLKDNGYRTGLIGISFTRHFYKPQPIRTLEEIRTDILALEKETEGLLNDIIGG